MEYQLINFLRPGCIIMSTRYNTLSYLLSPSIYNHASIFFGNGLKTYLQTIDNGFIDKDQLNKINDTIYYIIHSNGYITTYEEVITFIGKNNDIAIYYYMNDDKYDYESMYIVSRYICYYIGVPFSFFDYGVYCFEIIIKSYKYINKNIKFKNIQILFNRFYNSNSIVNNLNFKCVYKNYNIHKKWITK